MAGGKRAPTLKFGCHVTSGKASSSLGIPIWYRKGWGWGLRVCSMLLFPAQTGVAELGSETLDRGITAIRADGQAVMCHRGHLTLCCDPLQKVARGTGQEPCFPVE